MTERAQSAPASLEDVYRAHRADLLGLAYLMCGSRDTSEDIVQAAFASAHERWASVEQPLAYLRRSVVNLAKDGQRRRFRALARAPLGTPDVVLPPELDETWEAVSRLPLTQRAVVTLHYYADLPLTEIANVLGRPAATVRSDHRRALAKLRKALQ